MTTTPHKNMIVQSNNITTNVGHCVLTLASLFLAKAKMCNCFISLPPIVIFPIQKQNRQRSREIQGLLKDVKQFNMINHRVDVD